VPQIKKNVLNACAQTVAADGVIEEMEAELLRAIADTLDCPIRRSSRHRRSGVWQSAANRREPRQRRSAETPLRGSRRDVLSSIARVPALLDLSKRGPMVLLPLNLLGW